jgi:hypothetical protein
VRILGASHLDPENPGSRASRWFGQTSDRAQCLYQRLMYLFFRDAFGLAPFPGEPESFAREISALADEHSVRVIRRPD